MCEVLVAVLVLDTDLQAACLCIAEVRAAADLKILLLARAPRLNIAGNNLQVSEVSGAACKLADRNVHRAEQLHGESPELLIPVHRLFRPADNNHFLLLELMDTVNTALLNSMCALFLAEARAVGSECSGECILRKNLVDERTDHRMLRGSDEVQVLALNLIHHGVHFGETHDTVDNCSADHKRRDYIRESLIDHEIARIGKNGGMESCDVAFQIIESVSGNSSRGIEIDTVKTLHNLCVIGNFKIRHERIAESLKLNILRIIFSDRDLIRDHLRNDHHVLVDNFLSLFLNLIQLLKPLCIGSDLLLDSLGFFLPAFFHQHADLLAETVSLRTDCVCLSLCLAGLCILRDDFVNQRKLLVLELLADVFLYRFRIFSYKFDVEHVLSSDRSGGLSSVTDELIRIHYEYCLCECQIGNVQSFEGSAAVSVLALPFGLKLSSAIFMACASSAPRSTSALPPFTIFV